MNASPVGRGTRLTPPLLLHCVIKGASELIVDIVVGVAVIVMITAITAIITTVIIRLGG